MSAATRYPGSIFRPDVKKTAYPSFVRFAQDVHEERVASHGDCRRCVVGSEPSAARRAPMVEPRAWNTQFNKTTREQPVEGINGLTQTRQRWKTTTVTVQSPAFPVSSCTHLY